MADMTLEWGKELERWLKPFLDRLDHKARRRMCPLYVAGLIGPGDRKSVQPMAARLAAGGYDQLHHFIADGIWDAAPLELELLIQADRLVGGKDAVLVIDDTAMPKKGERSVGVAPQYASALGKTANCQTLVSLTLARGEVPIMVALRLFVPESWTSDPVRLERAGVPVEYRAARTKPEIALAEIDRVMATGVRFGCVLADAGYGLERAVPPRAHGSQPCLGRWYSPSPQSVPCRRAAIWPVAARGRPRRRHVPDILSRPAEDMLANAKWRNISWRTGTKGKLKARFAAVRVRIADGPPQRIRDKGQQHLPGEEAWLIGEYRTSGEKKYYLANLPAGTDLRTLAAAIKARWICEQAHQQLKEELGLDHFEGRSWQGLHRHALMTMIADMLANAEVAETSAGEPVRKESSKPALPLSVCGLLMDLRSGSGTRVEQHLPGEEAWLYRRVPDIRERRNTISPTCPPAPTCAPWPPPSRRGGSASRPYQQLKEELGLDHFEGRSWQGLHRHALMTMIAYAFLQHRRLAKAGRGKRIGGPPPQPSLPAVRHAIANLMPRSPPHRCPHCRKWIGAGKQRE